MFYWRRPWRSQCDVRIGVGVEVEIEVDVQYFGDRGFVSIV